MVLLKKLILLVFVLLLVPISSAYTVNIPYNVTSTNDTKINHIHMNDSNISSGGQIAGHNIPADDINVTANFTGIPNTYNLVSTYLHDSSWGTTATVMLYYYNYTSNQYDFIADIGAASNGWVNNSIDSTYYISNGNASILYTGVYLGMFCGLCKELYIYEIRLLEAVPTLISPANQSTITKVYPPLTEDINFIWSSTNGALSSQLIVSEDVNFNILAVDTTITSNYYVSALEAGNYWWKVRYYNATSGIYYSYSNVSNFTLNNTAPVLSGTSIYGTVYKSTDGVVTTISGAEVRIWNNYSTVSYSMVTGSNGYYEFTGLNNSTTYYIQAKKSDEYDDSVIDLVTTGLGTQTVKNIRLFACTVAYNCFVGQHYVRFIVQNSYGAVYPGVYATVYKGTDVLGSKFGITGSDGSVSFLLLKDQYYQITFIKPSISMSVTWNGTPSLTEYPVYYDVSSGNLTSINITNATLGNYTITYTSQTWSIQNLTQPYLTSTLGIGPMGQGVLTGLLGWLLIGSGGIFAVLASYGILALLGVLSWAMALLIGITAMALFVLLGGIGQSW